MDAAADLAPDARHIVVDGRRWRATDPNIPDPLRRELVAELMSARRAVKAAKAASSLADERRARARVHDAKVALGERGEPWWDDPTPDGLASRAASAIRALLAKRGAGRSICPSEAARVAASPGWRSAMGDVRAVAADLAAAGEITITQGGEPVDPAHVSGAIRLRSTT